MGNLAGRFIRVEGGPYFWLGALLSFLPPIVGAYGTSLVTQILILGIFALSLNLLMGYGGLPSFGHAAFWGVGAYSIGLMTRHGLAGNTGPGFLLALGLGILAAAILAAIFGLVVFRSTGVYFLMLTLALAQALWGVAWRWRSLTGGDDGLTGISRPVLGLSFQNNMSFYYLVLFFFLLCLFVLWRMVNSPFGRVTVGIRENEDRMQGLGYNTWLYKYACYVVAGTFGGVAGILSAYFNSFVSPSDLNWVLSASAMIMVIVGGAGVFSGPLIGAAVVLLLQNVVSTYTTNWLFIQGALFIAVILCIPEGVAGYLSRRVRARWRRR